MAGHFPDFTKHKKSYGKKCSLSKVDGKSGGDATPKGENKKWLRRKHMAKRNTHLGDWGREITEEGSGGWWFFFLGGVGLSQ